MTDLGRERPYLSTTAVAAIRETGRVRPVELASNACLTVLWCDPHRLPIAAAIMCVCDPPVRASAVLVR
jgi:hypothetical protein